MIIDWGLEFVLETPQGDITFNAINGDGPKLVPSACVAQYTMRSSKDNIPQADGDEVHRAFRGGYDISLTVELWENDTTVACDEQITVRGDILDGFISSLQNPPDQLGRLVWTPSGGSSRMFNQLSLWSAPVPAQPEDGPIVIHFELVSPFPYGMEELEQDETVPPGTTVVTVPGNTGTYPVLRVQGGGGGVNDFIISNVTLGAALVYSGASIPAGQYLEINMFAGTAFLNGNGANFIAGFDPQLSEFFYLLPGDNQIDINTPTVDFLINGAWA